MKLVTVKLPRHLTRPHDPAHKKTGKCPLGGGTCTDVTGAHHTVVALSDFDLEEIRRTWGHITRIEEA